MLKFQNITKIFKSDIMTQPFVALDDVSFDIPHGSMVGFLGANGAGKTTSLKIIMDFIRADSGTVNFDKELGTTKEQIFKHIGFLPERPYFYPNLTGNEFLHFMGLLSEVSKDQIEASIKAWSPRFRIDHALSRPLRTYSKGMLQRIGFLSTILHEPKFIILDEPLSGLDPIGRKELKDVIIEVHKEGKTVFFSSHIVSDIEEICDRVVFLKEGKLVYDGKVDDLLRSNKQSEYILTVKKTGDLKISTPVKGIVDLPGDLAQIHIQETDKLTALSELLNMKIDIRKLEVKKQTLEEIFYHIKG